MHLYFNYFMCTYPQVLLSDQLKAVQQHDLQKTFSHILGWNIYYISIVTVSRSEAYSCGFQGLSLKSFKYHKYNIFLCWVSCICELMRPSRLFLQQPTTK
jgi:hypothetical protein